MNRNMAPELSKLALVLIDTCANSVPSERAFSTMNLRQSSLGNRLEIPRLDKVSFIYINSRSLRHASTPSIPEAEGASGGDGGLRVDIILNIDDGILAGIEGGVIDRVEEQEPLDIDEIRANAEPIDSTRMEF
ncbi:hypothetical protein BJ875DRAFT_444443 [Amylocarpus encephaloides]|uniref:Uncharacterized protein n=1 Tax=Amylocarpus encephaloides TaxID=45428 RepID=A0A9P8C2K1_9HELO|nr:hypothetical protein BJ875DRAFT_444443 [Amylocarpus encephaloides]